KPKHKLYIIRINMMLELPDSIIQHIFTFCNERLVIYFHKRYPNLLRTSCVTKLHLINQSLQHHIRIFKQKKGYQIETILPNLTQLDCQYCDIEAKLFEK